MLKMSFAFYVTIYYYATKIRIVTSNNMSYLNTKLHQIFYFLFLLLYILL